MPDFKLCIGEVLKTLLEKEKISITAFSKKLKIPKATLFGYLQNVMPQKAEHIAKLCNHFQITTDYLLFGCKNCKKRCKTDLKRDTVIKGVFKIIEIDKVIEVED